MPTLRTTALVDAPARTVTGAVIEVCSRRASLMSLSDLSAGFLVPALRAGRLTAQCVQTGAGTLLTCSFSWAGGLLLARRPVLSLVTSVASGVAARAVEVAGNQVVVGTLLVRDSRLLAQQRAFPDSVAGLWELPGGRVEAGESDLAAVERECVEELGVVVTPGEQVGPDLILPGGKLLRIYRGRLAADAVPVALEHKAVRWLGADELADVDWLPADRILLPLLRRLVSGLPR
jgi:8-oxo-dGTP diphosphatase